MARRGADMIRKLLAFGRHEHLEMEGVALEPVVRDAVELMRHMLPEHIELALTSSLPAGTVVRADPSAVQQMLINLATNAQDAMPSGGRLSLDLSLGDVDEARVATHGWGAPGVHVCLRVSDSGAGMAPDVLARATEPFFTTRSGGAGLGLTMVYGLMKHHGGFLELASEPGRGTTARLCFPRTDGRPAPATTAPAAGGGETILLVEDEVSIRRAARRVLERFGYRVVTAADGEEGLARWREQRGAIDLVVSDAIMPRMGGGALYERLRAEDPAVRFLLCSGYTGQQLRGAGEEGGAAVPFLAKPWTVDDLLAAVRDALTGPTRA
jgi:CheY-like chemotaxis protein